MKYVFTVLNIVLCCSYFITFSNSISILPKAGVKILSGFTSLLFVYYLFN